MSGERWRKLEVWKLSDELARSVYRTTQAFPREELYGLSSQLRRAALSVPTNIVEGYSRKGEKELVQFLSISIGSLAEVKYLLYFANSLGFLSQDEYSTLDQSSDQLGAKLWQFYQSVRSK